MKVRILLINAVDITKPLQTSLPPLGLGYLISSLRNEFGEEVFDFKIIDRDIEMVLRSYKPDVVGITAVSQNYNYAIEYARLAKKRRIPVLVGGTHISVLPTTLTKDMDIAVIGEGEEAMKELFSVYLKRSKFEKKDIKKIRGLVFWDKSSLVRTEDRPPISRMDSIPYPARDLMKIEKCTHVFSSRGCPYRCIFCASSRFWNKTRFFPARYVVKEIKTLYEQYGVREIDFWDDLFIVSKDRIKEIVRLLRKEGLLGRIKFSCAVRSNLIDESMVKLLKKLNVRGVSMGLESGTSRILDYLKGHSVNINNHQKAIRLFKKYGIEPSASFIIGSPTETRDEIMQTFKFIRDSKLRGFAREKGLVSEKMNWSTLNVEFLENHEGAIILSETLTRDELYQLILMFKAEQKRRHIIDLMKHPVNILRIIYHTARNLVNFNATHPLPVN